MYTLYIHHWISHNSEGSRDSREESDHDHLYFATNDRVWSAAVNVWPDVVLYLRLQMNEAFLRDFVRCQSNNKLNNKCQFDCND